MTWKYMYNYVRWLIRQISRIIVRRIYNSHLWNQRQRVCNDCLWNQWPSVYWIAKDSATAQPRNMVLQHEISRMHQSKVKSLEAHCAVTIVSLCWKAKETGDFVQRQRQRLELFRKGYSSFFFPFFILSRVQAYPLRLLTSKVGLPLCLLAYTVNIQR